MLHVAGNALGGRRSTGQHSAQQELFRNSRHDDWLPYQISFSPPCNCRPTVCELVSLPKLAFPTVSAALVGLDRLKKGVFERLNDSARNSRRCFSWSTNSLNTEKSRLRWPGPRNLDF